MQQTKAAALPPSTKCAWNLVEGKKVEQCITHGTLRPIRSSLA
jgi:hypothetical protein